MENFRFFFFFGFEDFFSGGMKKIASCFGESFFVSICSVRQGPLCKRPNRHRKTGRSGQVSVCSLADFRRDSVRDECFATFYRIPHVASISMVPGCLAAEKRRQLHVDLMVVPNAGHLNTVSGQAGREVRPVHANRLGGTDGYSTLSAIS